MRLATRIGRGLAGVYFATAWAVPGTAAAGDFGASAQGSFTYQRGDDIALDLNTMNRGDNPFSAFRFLLATRGRVNETTDLFLEVPFDASANSSLFMTYVRPFARISTLGGAPWLNLQAGRLPTVFGTYGERAPSTESGVLGVPLLYFYHSAVRGDLIPEGPDYFFQPGIRGGGYKPVTIGNRTSFVGLPPVYESCWDVGAELYGTAHGLQFSMAGTQGSVSRPSTLGKDNNDGKGVVGRLGYQVESGSLFGLRVGASGGVGSYLNESLESDALFPAGRDVGDFLNMALGLDFSYATGPWQFFAEGARIAYEVPNVEPTLSLVSYYLELVRDFGPSFSVGLRQEAVLYSDITSSEGATESWDYDVWRWETALNYRFARGSRVRFGYQWTRVPDERALDGQLVALQLQVWTR